jgi:methionine-rich copper-binding protein CopC
LGGDATDENAGIEIISASNLDGTIEERSSQIIVTAENGISKANYFVEFYVLSNDSTLSDLNVDGETIDDFGSQTFSYLEKLAAGTSLIPAVTGVASDDSASLEIIPATNLNVTQIERTSQIIVSAEDGISEGKYSIEFYIMSNDSTLSDLTIDGNTIDGFVSTSFDYNYELGSESEAIPTVTGVLSNDSASIEIIPATNLTGDIAARTTLIQVTAEDDSYTATYRVVFEVKPSSIVTNQSVRTLIYPTIVQNEFSIRHFEEIKLIEIISITGNVTHMELDNKYTERIDATALKAGLYIIRISSDSGIYVSRILKQ